MKNKAVNVMRIVKFKPINDLYTQYVINKEALDLATEKGTFQICYQTIEEFDELISNLQLSKISYQKVLKDENELNLKYKRNEKKNGENKILQETQLMRVIDSEKNTEYIYPLDNLLISKINYYDPIDIDISNNHNIVVDIIAKKSNLIFSTGEDEIDYDIKGVKCISLKTYLNENDDIIVKQKKSETSSDKNSKLDYTTTYFKYSDNYWYLLSKVKNLHNQVNELINIITPIFDSKQIKYNDKEEEIAKNQKKAATKVFKNKLEKTDQLEENAKLTDVLGPLLLLNSKLQTSYVPVLTRICTDGYKKQIGLKIRKLAVSSNINQKDITNFLGISQQSISQYYRGETFPEIQNLRLITDKLGVNYDTLLDPLHLKQNFEKDEIYRDIGLIPKTINHLRKLKKANPYLFEDITQLLNIIILNTTFEYNEDTNNNDLLMCILDSVDLVNSTPHVINIKELHDRMTFLAKTSMTSQEKMKIVNNYINDIEEKNITSKKVESTFFKDAIDTITQNILNEFIQGWDATIYKKPTDKLKKASTINLPFEISQSDLDSIKDWTMVEEDDE